MIRQNPRSEAGLTLLEVIIATAILAVVVCGTLSAVMSSYRLNTRSREETVALGFAQDMMAQVRNTQFENIVATYNGMTFVVNELTPLTGAATHGEVIIITDETPDESAYSRDLEGLPGPDGLDLNGDGDRVDTHTLPAADCAFPIDLDGDGAADKDVVPAADMKVIPVVILIRWRSTAGTGRLQLVTFIADRDG